MSYPLGLLTPVSHFHNSHDPNFDPRSTDSLIHEETRTKHTISGANGRTNDKASSSHQSQSCPIVPSPTGPPKSLDQFSRDEFVWLSRACHEDEHFADIRRNSVEDDFRVNIEDMSFLTRMDLTHFQDTCNKSVAIYTGCSDWQYRTMNRVIFNYVYRRWYRPYRNDIYHQRYLCKLIALEGLPDAGNPTIASNRARTTSILAVRNKPNPNRGVIDSLVNMHRFLCDDAEAMKARGFDPEKHFVVQPLFKALLILVDPAFYRLEDSKQVGRMPVFMVKTGVKDGLSEPVTFDSIQRKITSSYEIDEMEVVKTSLAAAIDLVMTLEVRETVVCGSRPNPYITSRQDAKDLNKKLVKMFGPDVELVPDDSLDHEWVDTRKHPRWEAAATVMPNRETVSIYDAGNGKYRIPQLVMVLQEQGLFNDQELRRTFEGLRKCS
ncbi:hypothetical protein QBC37DRAFT_367326 [Rhypophila decipiens]|uniref:Uncharacterized protein n=1 Tax=Rhypophila decipiens TaxID=261697 RepID=A0AAN6YKX5_9PEZI|nr:hypothetical protein QBC37DRAFT_367326 [Rhypophila decipiens]